MGFGVSSSALAQEETADSAMIAEASVVAPAVAYDLTLADAPNDGGHKVIVSFSQPQSTAGIMSYEIYRALSADGPWKKIGAKPTDVDERLIYKDAGGRDPKLDDYLPNETDFYYLVRSITSDSAVYADSEIAGPVQTIGQWWNFSRMPVFYFVFFFTVLTVFYVRRARTHGESLYVRPLAGIDAVDEAIGRATEMGKPILYVLGLGTASDIATIASFTVLGRVARKVAEYQTELIVPCYDPIVFTIAQETVRTGYLDAGRPDYYQEDHVYFVTQAQFAYVAAVNGTMLRERPATNIYLGKFFAESLILAETGAVAGSIQIAGTDEIAQLPFFVVACDYTLIGEELYAASAYLGKEPLLLGALKAQDYAKAAVIVIAIIGFIMASFDAGWFVDMFETHG